jgi:hypothetical protein
MVDNVMAEALAMLRPYPMFVCVMPDGRAMLANLLCVQTIVRIMGLVIQVTRFWCAIVTMVGKARIALWPFLLMEVKMC